MFSSTLRCKVIAWSLMRLFLAETSKYGPSTFLQMCSLLLKGTHFCIFICQYSTDLIDKHLHQRTVRQHTYRPTFTSRSRNLLLAWSGNEQSNRQETICLKIVTANQTDSTSKRVWMGGTKKTLIIKKFAL